jgi:LacI family repressor for deo operon, udp, cdd, tsx, nupC, and nupG
MATIYDIAKHVGVSAGTVSRALSRPDKVLPATRTRIEQAAAALGYVPNTVARTLKTQRSGKILVTVPDIANPFFAQILQGAEDAAQAVGYAVLLGDTQDQPDREERYAQMLRRNEADGMIVLGHRLPPTAREIVQQRGCRAGGQRLRVRSRAGPAQRAHRQCRRRTRRHGALVRTGP